jgi:hypothetical protein
LNALARWSSPTGTETGYRWGVWRELGLGAEALQSAAAGMLAGIVKGIRTVQTIVDATLCNSSTPLEATAR